MCETVYMLRAILSAAAAVAAPAAAEVVQSAPGGFEVKNEITVDAPIERAWAVVVAPRLWWNKDHTYSEDSTNLTLDERPGGCFCEKLPNKGGVEHMRVVYIQPPRMIRLVGALGPLQAEAADGTMAITLVRSGSQTNISMTYVAGGYIRAGAEKLAPVVDRVLGEQLAGLKKAVDGGAAAAGPVAGPSLTPAAKPRGRAPARPAAPQPRIEADPLADVGQTISGLDTDAPAADAPAADPTPAASPRPRPADQDSPR